jgi:hypothetical protein
LKIKIHDSLETRVDSKDTIKNQVHSSTRFESDFERDRVMERSILCYGKNYAHGRGSSKKSGEQDETVNLPVNHEGAIGGDSRKTLCVQ